MTNLRQLLATWETWSAHDTLSRASSHTVDGEPTVSALDALRDSSELVELLTGWQWQAMYAARRAGAGWEHIGSACHTSGDAARAELAEVLDRQELVLGRDVSAYREVL